MGWIRARATSGQTSLVSDLAGVVALAIVVVVTPGPDTALTIRNTLIGGRTSGVATAVGVALGQATWSLATSAGISALIAAAEPAFVALKLAGSAYLVFLGAQSLWSALRPASEPRRPVTRRRLGGSSALRQGLISNLTNPKMAVFFPSSCRSSSRRAQPLSRSCSRSGSPSAS